MVQAGAHTVLVGDIGGMPPHVTCRHQGGAIDTWHGMCVVARMCQYRALFLQAQTADCRLGNWTET